MHAFETLLAILFGAVLLSLLARRINIPFPPLLALAGAGVAFLPFAPELELDPELVLALFLAPVLLDAAFDSSPRDLKRNAAPIAFLTLATVGVTVVAVALTARGLQPALSWSVAIALGAIVAPPDAAAATAVLRAVPVPHRLRTILEGESLFNDASALLTYRLAVTATMSGIVMGWPLAGAMVWAVLGSLLVGAGVAWLTARLLGPLTDAPSSILLQFIGAFGVWIVAERIGLSAIITVVVYGMVSARVSARRVSALVRAPSYAVWETAVFALNATAFALVGLQIGPVWRDLESHQQMDYALFALIVLGVAIATRLAWVMIYNTLLRLGTRVLKPNLLPGEAPPDVRSGLIVGWAGMRGVVSLAAAYALPYDFPHRDLLLLTTVAVVIGTLVLQGLTLGPLIRLLKIEDDGVLPAEIKLAREAVTEAALKDLAPRRSDAAGRLRAEYQRRLKAIRSDVADDGRVELESDQLSASVLDAKRDALSRLRRDGDIGEAAYYQLEEELDRHELSLSPVIR